jgi:hypothetical protein
MKDSGFVRVHRNELALGDGVAEESDSGETEGTLGHLEDEFELICSQRRG